MPTGLLLEGSRLREHWGLLCRGRAALISCPGLAPSADLVLCCLVFFHFFKNTFYFEKDLKYGKSTQGKNLQLTLRTDNCSSLPLYPTLFCPGFPQGFWWLGSWKWR